MAAPFHLERLLFTPATPSNQATPVIFAFPNEYSIGITSLGYQIIWAMLVQRSDLDVARWFTDGHEPLPSRAELLGVSISWELDYANILTMLESLDVPILTCDRGNEHPLIFGGGPVLTANPEPFAAFFDVVLLGDGEVVLDAFIDAYQTVRDGDRTTQLRRLAQVPGVYIPALYEPTYVSPTGPLASIQPVDTDIPPLIEKQTYRGNTLSTSSVVTEKAAWENIYMVEVVRSCPEMCRFCLASYLTLPFRAASVTDSLIPSVEKGLAVTNRLGLLGASVTQHPAFDDLLEYLNQAQFDDVRLSLSSVRTNTVNEKLTSTLTRHGAKSITIAIESGSERVRQIVNKKLATDDIRAAAVNAKAGGLNALKLYGMAGIPGEELADLEATAELMLELKKAVPGLRLTLGCSTFVPKAHTPFQWYGVNPQAEKRLKLLQKRLRPKGIDFRPESYNWSVIQALISRGDRRLTPLLLQVREFGDSLGSYKRAFKALKGQLPPLDFYVHEHWERDQILPWEHLQGPLPKATLLKHEDSAAAHFASDAEPALV
ncbi:MAG: radical SAM protein [Cyanobacteria bacterium P01_C01_bin.120]